MCEGLGVLGVNYVTRIYSHKLQSVRYFIFQTVKTNSFPDSYTIS